MRILVTGGAGFIGSHTVDLLITEGHEVLVVDDLSSGSAGNVRPPAQLVVLPIESPRLSRAFKGFGPEAVVHCAAQTSVAVSWRRAGKDAAINIGGSINVIENSVRFGVKRLAYCSSAAVYGNPLAVPLSEAHPTSPISPYGISKLAVEHYLRAYSEQYGLSYAALRFANVYGPRQKAELEGGVVAVFLDKIASGETLVVEGDGRQTRDFVFVGDVARALVLAVEAGGKARHGGSFVANVSTSSETSINDLFETIKEITGRRVAPAYGPPRPGDIRRSCLDNSRLKELLEWSPGVTLQDGLAATWRHVTAEPVASKAAVSSEV